VQLAAHYAHGRPPPHAMPHAMPPPPVGHMAPPALPAAALPSPFVAVPQPPAGAPEPAPSAAPEAKPATPPLVEVEVEDNVRKEQNSVATAGNGVESAPPEATADSASLEDAPATDASNSSPSSTALHFPPPSYASVQAPPAPELAPAATPHYQPPPFGSHPGYPPMSHLPQQMAGYLPPHGVPPSYPGATMPFPPLSEAMGAPPPPTGQPEVVAQHVLSVYGALCPGLEALLRCARDQTEQAHVDELLGQAHSAMHKLRAFYGPPQAMPGAATHPGMHAFAPPPHAHTQVAPGMPVHPGAVHGTDPHYAGFAGQGGAPPFQQMPPHGLHAVAYARPYDEAHSVGSSAGMMLPSSAPFDAQAKQAAGAAMTSGGTSSWTGPKWNCAIKKKTKKQ